MPSSHPARRIGARLGAVLVTLAALGWSASPALAAVNEAERAFIVEAVQDGALEVSLGQLAIERAGARGVRALARRLVRDHEEANRRLAALAEREGVAVPAGLSVEGQRARQGLAALEGAAFDRAYLSRLDEDHGRDIAAFEAQAKTAVNPRLKAFVAETLPALRAHERLVSEELTGGGAGRPERPADPKQWGPGFPRGGQRPDAP